MLRDKTRLGPLAVGAAVEVVQGHAIGGGLGQGGVERGVGRWGIASDEANGFEAKQPAGGGHGGDMVRVGTPKSQQRVVALLPGGHEIILELTGLVTRQVGVGQVVAPQQQLYATGGGHRLTEFVEERVLGHETELS